jgi:3-hydroxybutyryl-CoA dehydrogenase
MSEDDGLRHAAIVGAGRRGIGIGENLAIAGLEVTFVDANAELSASALDRLSERVRGHAAAGLIDEQAVARAATARVAEDLAAAVATADLIIEAVTEDIDVKREVLGACDAAAPDGAILASNTSSLSINELVGFVVRQDRFIGMHWFNPPEWTPGVEVVPTEFTDPSVVSRVVELLERVGKRPSTVTPSVGFIANRLQMALFSEAARCVEEGLASPREIDEVVRSCFGFRLPFFGPFQIADMAGLDVYQAVLEQHRQAFGDRFLVPDMLREQVRQGRRGTSAGGGFYDYPGGASSDILVERDSRYAALAGLLTESPPLEFEGGEIPADGAVTA